jgi:hypothetical protein
MGCGGAWFKGSRSVVVVSDGDGKGRSPAQKRGWMTVL